MRLITQQEANKIYKKLPQIKTLIELGAYNSDHPLAIEIDLKLRADKELQAILKIMPKAKVKTAKTGKSYCDYCLRALGYHVTSSHTSITKYTIHQGVIAPPPPASAPAGSNTKKSKQVDQPSDQPEDQPPKITDLGLFDQVLTSF
jgi:hypothetical protein